MIKTMEEMDEIGEGEGKKNYPLITLGEIIVTLLPILFMIGIVFSILPTIDFAIQGSTQEGINQQVDTGEFGDIDNMVLVMVILIEGFLVVGLITRSITLIFRESGEQKNETISNK